jgi:hypothetical protein
VLNLRVKSRRRAVPSDSPNTSRRNTKTARSIEADSVARQQTSRDQDPQSPAGIDLSLTEEADDLIAQHDSVGSRKVQDLPISVTHHGALS